MDYNNNPLGSDHNSHEETGHKQEEGADKKEMNAGWQSGPDQIEYGQAAGGCQTAYGGNPYEQNAYQNNYQDPYSQYGYRNPYQPAAQPAYRTELEEPVSMADWLGTILLAFIPCAGVIVYLIWAFSSDTKKSKSNFCKAVLIVYLAMIALSFIIGIFNFALY